MVQDAIRQIEEIKAKLDEVARDLDQVVETLEQIERQNVATDEEMASLRSALRSLHRNI